MGERFSAAWLHLDPSQTSLASAVRQIHRPDASGSAAARSSTYRPDQVWSEALRGAALATSRWQLWMDEAFWQQQLGPYVQGTVNDDQERTVEALTSAVDLHGELLWRFNQPGARLAPTLRAFLESCPWTLPLRDPVDLGERASSALRPPRALLDDWGAGPSAPVHMERALEVFTAGLCARADQPTDAGGLSEVALDQLLCWALELEFDCAPRWIAEGEEERDAERRAVCALERAVPAHLWPMLRQTRAHLAEWRETRASRLGSMGLQALARIARFDRADLVLSFAEELTGRPYAFVQELWDRRGRGARSTEDEQRSAACLKRAGFFVNYASSVEVVTSVLLPSPSAHAWPSGAANDPRLLLSIGGFDLLVRLDRGEPGERGLRRFVRPAGDKPGFDMALWGERLQSVADGRAIRGEVHQPEWPLAGDQWQPRLIEALAEANIFPDEGLQLFRGVPDKYQAATRERIAELRGRR